MKVKTNIKSSVLFLVLFGFSVSCFAGTVRPIQPGSFETASTNNPIYCSLIFEEKAAYQDWLQTDSDLKVLLAEVNGKLYACRNNPYPDSCGQRVYDLYIRSYRSLWRRWDADRAAVLSIRAEMEKSPWCVTSLQWCNKAEPLLRPPAPVAGW